MTEKQLMLEDFADKVGDIFVLDTPETGPIELTLVDAIALRTHNLPAHFRPPFSLTFQAGEAPLLPQAQYKLEHAVLGLKTIFLVAASYDQGRARYHATFN